MGIDLSGNVDGIVQTVFDRGAYPHYFLGSESKRKQIYAGGLDVLNISRTLTDAGLSV